MTLKAPYFKLLVSCLYYFVLIDFVLLFFPFLSLFFLIRKTQQEYIHYLSLHMIIKGNSFTLSLYTSQYSLLSQHSRSIYTDSHYTWQLNGNPPTLSLCTSQYRHLFQHSRSICTDSLYTWQLLHTYSQYILLSQHTFQCSSRP